MLSFSVPAYRKSSMQSVKAKKTAITNIMPSDQTGGNRYLATPISRRQQREKQSELAKPASASGANPNSDVPFLIKQFRVLSFLHERTKKYCSHSVSQICCLSRSIDDGANRPGRQVCLRRSGKLLKEDFPLTSNRLKASFSLLFRCSKENEKWQKENLNGQTVEGVA